jgi:hypothetical protein
MNIPPVVGTILRSAAPTLLTAIAIPPPFGLIASAVVSGLLARYLPPDVKPAQPPPQPGAPPTLTPAQVVQVVQANASDPQFMATLRQAELELQKYEMEQQFRFAELEVKDRTRAGDFQTASSTALPLLKWGMAIVVLSIGAMMSVIVGALLLIAGAVRIPAETAQMAIGVFGLIGSVVGFLSSYGTQILGFYYGSSVGSGEKTAELASTLRDQTEALGEAAAAGATERARPQPPVVVQVPPAPVVPIDLPLAADWKQGPFGGVRFRLDADGYVLVEGEAAPGRTVGEPATVRRIWREYGAVIEPICASHGVPIELVVAVIATESRGQVNASLTEPDGRTSVGLMQILTGTASEVMGRPINGRELQEPALNIEAGVRYIRSQYNITAFLPPFVAAAYNAGGLYPPREQDRNRWRLRSTGDHIDRAVLYFNDCAFVARADGWTRRAS